MRAIQWDPYLLTAGRPYGSGTLPAGARFQLDEFGLRAGPARSDTSYRIALLGGSNVWGIEIADQDQTLSACLERELALRHGFSCSVTNAGGIAYTAFQQFILFVLKLAAFDFDAVVVLNGHEDYQRSRSNPAPSRQEDDLYHALVRYLNAGAERRLLLDCFDPLSRRAEGLVIPAQGGREATTSDAYFHDIASLVDVALGQEVEPLVVLEPAATELASYQRLADGLSALCERRRVCFWNSATGFADRPHCFSPSGLLNELGTARLADGLATVIASRLAPRIADMRARAETNSR